MEFRNAFGHNIHLTNERLSHIQYEHPEIIRIPNFIKEVLQNPDFIAKSVHDPEVVLYYKFYRQFWNGKYVVVVVKQNHRHFVLTAYVTDRMKGGVIIWRKN